MASAEHRRESLVDDEQLEHLGHVQELRRQFSFLSMLGLAFAILNSWTALSASLSLALPSGGPVSVLWGLITAGVCNLALAASLAEFLSAYPTAGGQYHWVAVTAPQRWVESLSWITGWINTAGWVALTATGGLLGSQLIVGIISLRSPSYEPQRWHQFLIYIGYTLAAFLINAFANAALPYFNKAAFMWSVGGFTIICITVLACSSPDYASADFVFRALINETGWPDGIAWLLGLLQGGLGVTGFDAVAHMIEEIPNATVEGPKIMIYCVAIGIFTGFVFLMVLLFVSGGPDAVSGLIEGGAGPLLGIFYTATKNQAGAICLLIFPLVCLLFATTGIMTTSSRMTYAFARDGGIPASRFFAQVHHKLGVPLNSLGLTTVLVIIFGCIFLGSTAAFNAITAASVVALGVSYAMPIAVNVAQGRKALPPRPFTLPAPLGWACNLLGLAYVVLTTVLFLFPPELPVDAANMNYCVVAFGIVMLVSLAHWVFSGRKHYTGPTIDEHLLVATSSQPPAIQEYHGPSKAQRSSDEAQTEAERKVV